MPEVLWIDSSGALEAALDRLGAGPVGFDLEADSFHHFHAKVCLMQLSAPGIDLLIDPLADDLDVSRLAALFSDTGRCKVLHGGDYDVRMLRGGHGLALAGLFDTHIAARLLGEQGVGLAALLERHLGVQVDKRFQRADWSMRPLPQALRDYAALDTRYLIELSGLLARRLADAGRSAWAEEEFERLARLEPSAPEAEPWRRIKGASVLDRRELAGLRELSDIRDEIARARDLPRFRVAMDEALVSAARAFVRTGGSIEAVASLPSTWRVEPWSSSWAAAVRRLQEMSPADWPERLERSRPTRDPEREAELRRLAAKRDRLAKDLALEPSIVATRGQLEDVLDSLAGGLGVRGARSLRRWQRELLAPMLDG